MTRKELMQLQYLKREIAMWERELEEVMISSEISSPNIGGCGSQKASSPTESRALKKQDIIDRIKNLKQNAEEEFKNLINYIESLEDSLMRQIIYYRCVKGFSWVWVAKKIGGPNTAESLRKTWERTYPKK